MNVQLTDLLAPNFHELINPVLDNKVRELMLTGGRGSTKSSFASLIIPWGMMEDYYLHKKLTHAVVMRKVANTCRNTVYKKIKWGLNQLKVSHLWKCTLNPLQATFLPSGQQILFFGCDEPTKIKSITPESGYIKYRWYEEYDQFDGLAEIRNLNQSIARGGDCLGIYSFNPPPNKSHWANIDSEDEKIGRLRHHSTYLTVDEKWLGPDFIIEAKDLKKKNKKAYDNEYLGKATGIGGEVFKNIKSITLLDEDITLFEKIRQGLDFGFTVDPSAFVKSCYQKNKRSLTPFDEIFEYSIGTRELSELVNEKCHPYELIKADSQEKRTINTMCTEYYVNAYPCVKGADSVRHGVKFLQDLDAIYIDRKRTPNVYREFSTYEYDKNKEGKWIKQYPDRDNHTIDAIRYSLDDVILATGWRVQAGKG